jgi:hypothetical protein
VQQKQNVEYQISPMMASRIEVASEISDAMAVGSLQTDAVARINFSTTCVAH